MIKGILADLFISVYILSTLLLRFIVEPQLADHPIISIALGFVLILFLVALVKTKVIEPNYFGLLTKGQKQTNHQESDTDAPAMFI